MLDALQLLYIQKFIEFKSASLVFGYGVVFVIDPPINNILLVAGCLFTGGFDFEGF
jgi:hypothetical protein